MDRRAFDSLARALGSAPSRRGLLAGLLAALAPAAAGAGKKPRPKPYGAACASARGCRSGACAPAGPDPAARCARKGKPTGACACACAADAECGAGQRCQSGACVCDGRSCAGCCDGTTCLPGTADRACGTGGDACASCAASESCGGGPAGGCGCRADPDPCAGRCGVVTDNCGRDVDCTALCAGCCDRNACLPGYADGACGSFGAPCAGCAAPQRCDGSPERACV